MLEHVLQVVHVVDLIVQIVLLLKEGFWQLLQPLDDENSVVLDFLGTVGHPYFGLDFDIDHLASVVGVGMLLPSLVFFLRIAVEDSDVVEAFLRSD